MSAASETYHAALVLVQGIEADLTNRSGGRLPKRFYRNRQGRLLETLDEVVRAILADDLVLPETNGNSDSPRIS